MTKFILLTGRRSGTTLVIDCLNNHPDITCIKRAFGVERRIKNPTEHRHSSDFYLYRTDNALRKAMYLFRRTVVFHDYLANKMFTTEEAGTAKGFRVIYEISKSYTMIEDWVKQDNVKVIHLIRENVLKTYLSTETAKIHKMHHPREGDAVKPVSIYIDPGKIVNILKKRLEEIDSQRNRYSGENYLEVTYESFVNNRAVESDRILSHLEVDTNCGLQSDLVKINPNSVRDIIQNYAEVAEVVHAAGLERFLD